MELSGSGAFFCIASGFVRENRNGVRPLPTLLLTLVGAFSAISLTTVTAAITDTTQVLFAAPAYIFGNPDPVPMNHAHLIYLGADTSNPGGVTVSYSASLMGTGELGLGPGFIDGIYVDVQRPPDQLVPPYHLIGLAVSGVDTDPGGLLIGLGPVNTYLGLSFPLAFPGIDQQEVVSQLRSGNLSGGAVEALVTQLVLDQTTLQSPTPMPVPDGSLGLTGTVVGYSENGDPVELAGIAGPGDFSEGSQFYPEFGMYPLYPVIIPESLPPVGALAGFSVLLGWQTLKRRRNREECAASHA